MGMHINNNGSLYINTVIGKVAVDGWLLGLHLVQRGGARRAAIPPCPRLAVPNVNAHPSTATLLTSYPMRHCNIASAL